MVADIVNDPDNDSNVLYSHESNSVHGQQPLYTELLTQDCTNYMVADLVNESVHDSNVLNSHESNSEDEQLIQLLQSTNDSVVVNPQMSSLEPLYTDILTPDSTNYRVTDLVNELENDSEDKSS